MPGRTIIVICILALLAGVLGWNYFAKPFAPREPTIVEELQERTPSPSVSPQVSLSPEQTVAQVLAYPVLLTASTSSQSGTMAATAPRLIPQADAAWLAAHRPAFVTLFGSRISSNSARLATGEIRAVYNDQQVIIAVDHEGGVAQRLNGTGFTTVPSWRTLCTQSASQSASVIAQSLREVKAAGVDMIFAPVVDVGTSSVLASRICASSPEIVADNAARFITEATTQGLWPVIKHFPGLGSSTNDLHRSFGQVTVTASDAQVYQQLLNQYPSLAVMVTHVGVTNQYADIPCSYSKDCIGELKNNYSQSLVIADALEMAAAANVPSDTASSASGSATLGQRAIAAIKAGNQVLLFGQSVTAEQMDEVFESLLNEYQRNPTFKTQLDAAAARVYQLQKPK